MRVLCANWYGSHDADLERRLFPGIEFLLARGSEGTSSPLPEALCRDADAVINYSAVADLAEKPGAFPRARILVRAGVGFDNADLRGFGARGVPVCNVPDYGTTEVADHAIALMLALRRGTATYDHSVRGGVAGWKYRAAPLVGRLKGATFGVYGLGRIGLAAARRAAAFDMRVIFYDPYLSNGVDLATGYDRVHSLAALMAASDVVSIHAPLSPETRGVFNAAAFAAAKPGLVLVNTARGPIVDLDALADALRERKIGGAALDVLPKEPADPEHPLIRAWRMREDWIEGRLVLTPHAAFYSPASLEDLRRKAVEVVVAYLNEGRLTNCVNREYLAAAG
jgi:phosphoglycerate dehydrogenase-like enzyme